MSGISSVVDRIRQDAYNGDFDAVLERHSLAAVDVIGHVQDPSFLCQPGSVLRHQICGICRFHSFQIVRGCRLGYDSIRYDGRSLTWTEKCTGMDVLKQKLMAPLCRIQRNILYVSSAKIALSQCLPLTAVRQTRSYVYIRPIYIETTPI